MRLFKMTLGLVRYLIQSRKQKRTYRQCVDLGRDIVKTYAKEIFKEYKALFLYLDADYRESLRKYKRYEQAKKDVINAIKLLLYSKQKLQKAGISRQRIRRFFLTLGQDEEALKKLCDELLKEIK